MSLKTASTISAPLRGESELAVVEGRWKRLFRESLGILLDFLEHGVGEITLAERWDDGHTGLSSHLVTLHDLGGSRNDGAGRHANRKALFEPKAVRHFHGIVAVNGHNFVQNGQVKNRGNETRPHALNLVRSLLADLFPTSSLSDEHLLLGLDSDCVQVRVQGRKTVLLGALDELSDARHGPSSSDSRNKHVDGAVRVPPDLWPCRLPVDLGVAWVLELLQHVPLAIELLQDLFCLG
mmetsp:Transcript_30827/g.89532  ORF Transcript_30827/g.89532 Transcript_30827/m.89532 type:complete len:237 (+) Transcript_30827:216-926(+)